MVPTVHRNKVTFRHKRKIKQSQYHVTNSHSRRQKKGAVTSVRWRQELPPLKAPAYLHGNKPYKETVTVGTEPPRPLMSCVLT